MKTDAMCDCWPSRRDILLVGAAVVAVPSLGFGLGRSVNAESAKGANDLKGSKAPANSSGGAAETTGGKSDAGGADAGESATIVGPRKGFTPQIGTLSSMMEFMSMQLYMSTKGMSVQDLDFLLDAKANRIGALLSHLAATETYFQLNTFEGVKWDQWPEAAKKKWDVSMNLGDEARKTIMGKDLDFYVNQLKEAREKTLAEFRKRDDAWLMEVDKDWGWGPTNNYCKWFHVTEHEANHNGQIKLIKARLPGAKVGE